MTMKLWGTIKINTNLETAWAEIVAKDFSLSSVIAELEAIPGITFVSQPDIRILEIQMKYCKKYSEFSKIIDDVNELFRKKFEEEPFFRENEFVSYD